MLFLKCLGSYDINANNFQKICYRVGFSKIKGAW